MLLLQSSLLLQLVPSIPAKAASPAPQRAVFDAPKDEDIYANPPSILSTLQDQLQSDINDPALRWGLDPFIYRYL
jgi:hypothetical protein